MTDATARNAKAPAPTMAYDPGLVKALDTAIDILKLWAQAAKQSEALEAEANRLATAAAARAVPVSGVGVLVVPGGRRLI